MANLNVSLLRYVKTQSGWRRCRVDVIRKGRGLTEKLHTNGEVVHEAGAYQLKWYVGSKAKYKGAGDKLAEAILQLDKKKPNLKAEASADAADRTLVPENPDRKTLEEEGKLFVRTKALANKDKETVSAYRNLIAEFIEVTGRRYADRLTEDDVLEFCEALRDRGMSPRTVVNYYTAIATFLAHCGIDHKKLVKKDHRPTAEDPAPEAYSEPNVRRFLAALKSERDKLFFEFLLKTGCREKEATHLEWQDINWDDNVVNIKNVKILNLMVGTREKIVKFQTKTKKNRSITLETHLLEKLRAWRIANPTTRFVFGTGSDLPNGHYLEICKETARAAGLNCGTCKSCRKTDGKECGQWKLHKFRATFATWSLQGGLDIRTVQLALGHTKLEMTARYLEGAKG